MTDALLQPDQETREALAKNYWGANDHRNWSNIEPSEQKFLIEKWQRRQQQDAPASNAETMARVVHAAVRAQVEASLAQFRATTLPQMLSHDITALVAKALNEEVHGIDSRQRAQAGRIDERLDLLAGQVAKIQAYDGKSHAASMDRYLSELQGEVRTLQREVGELKGRIR